jgi:nucleoid DNA-binding protein
MKKKRKLKPMISRKSKDIFPFNEVRLEVAKKTGFRRDDVDAVFLAFQEVLTDAFMRKQSVRIPNIGTLSPIIKPSRVGMSLNGGKSAPTKMIVPDRYILRFYDSSVIREKLYQLPISQAEIDNMYLPEE